MTDLPALLAVATDPANLPQWGLILLAVAAGAVAARLMRRSGQAAVAGAGTLPGVVLPLVALLVLGTGWRLHWAHQQPLLLHVALALLLSLTVIRLGVRVIRTLLKAGGRPGAGWERSLARAVWGLFALHVLGVLDTLLELLDDLELPVGDHHVSVLRVLQGGAVILTAVILSLWLGRVLERRLMRMQAMDASLRVILAKVLHGALLTLAVLFALPMVGIDITFLSVIGGALGVGLGFGLQKIASNYVSGFIILLERSVRLQDVLTVDGRKGVVTRMEARYTVLKGSDGMEVVIPNETFVTAQVINHTLNGRAGHQSFSVWVDQQADLRQAIGLLEALVARQPGVAADPAPAVTVAQVVPAGIELAVGWWVPDLASADSALRPRLLLESVETLQAAGIRLARPGYPVG